VRFARDRTKRHGAGREAAYDLFGGLDFLDRHGLPALVLGGPDAEQAADRIKPLGLFIDVFGKGAVLLRNVSAHGVLQVRDRLGIPDVILAAQPQGIFAAHVEHVAIDRRLAEGLAMTAHGFLADFGQADSFDARRRA
jgi:hypothetical protein